MVVTESEKVTQEIGGAVGEGGGRAGVSGEGRGGGDKGGVGGALAGSAGPKRGLCLGDGVRAAPMAAAAATESK